MIALAAHPGMLVRVHHENGTYIYIILARKTSPPYKDFEFPNGSIHLLLARINRAPYRKIRQNMIGSVQFHPESNAFTRIA